MFFNIPLPNIFHLGEDARQGYQSHYERKIGVDARNIALLEPLEQTLFKLEDIRVRISTRIGKEVASGTDMTQAISLLSPTDQALLNAEQAVAIATSTVTGANPHPPYAETQDAYLALNQARNSLVTVLDAIISAPILVKATTTETTTTKHKIPTHAKK